MHTQDSAFVPSSIDSLLAHADWVRALARHLVRDPDTASEVEQEVWRAALERPPQHDANPRGWLATVARNAARALKRSEKRRTHREAAVARGEALPSSAELVEEAALSRELAGIVLHLDEPYRTTILLRYFRDHSIDEIASAQRLSRETVRTRQRRGLEMLRERLDASRGGRASWMAALAPFASVESRTAAASGTSALWLAALALVVAVGTWLAWPSSEQSAPLTEASPSALARNPDAMEAREAPSVSHAEPDTVRSSAHDSDAPAAVPTVAPTGRLAGSVIDAKGRALAGLELVLTSKYAARVEGDSVIVPTPPRTADGRPLDGSPPSGETVFGGWSTFHVSAEDRETYRQIPEALEDELARFDHAVGLREALLGEPPPCVRARTDAEGRFSVAVPEGTWDVEAAHEHSIVALELGSPASPDWTLVVVPAVRVAGFVLDDQGTPIDGAQVQHSTSSQALRELLFDRERTIDHWSARVLHAGKDGRFEFAKVPRFESDTISATADGFQGAEVTVPAVDTRDLRLVLARKSPEEDRARLRGIVLDADGQPAEGASVHLGQDRCSSGADGRFELVLSCCHEGYSLVALRKGFQPAVLAEFGRSKMVSQDDLVLRLGPATRSIRGRVVGPDGAPIAQAKVQILDGLVAGSVQCWAEDVAAGRYSSEVATDANGAFELGGLSPRAYRIGAWWDEAHVVVSEPIPAGSEEVVLTLRANDVRSEVRGRVVTRRGVPLRDAEVGVRLDTYRTKSSTSWRTFGKVTTDEHGEFVLRDVPKAWVGLVVSGKGLQTQRYELENDVTAELVLAVELETRIELEVTDERVRAIQFLDEEGKPLHVRIHLPGVQTTNERVARRDGVFPPFDLTDAAVTAVLLMKEGELRRAPIEIERVAVQRIQL
ncbi:MAG: sigma-70 family RNA polymerase sigma factor [Planctomycetes bacterium]|nr:sigma-70 family RNA polymerase sigma factor [Planctomycetota bacterium]